MKIYGRDSKNVERLEAWEARRRPRRSGDDPAPVDGVVLSVAFCLAFWAFAIGLFAVKFSENEVWPVFVVIGGLAVMAWAAWRLMMKGVNMAVVYKRADRRSQRSAGSCARAG